MPKTYTLNKSQRLRSPGDYRRVYQNKQWGNSSHHTFNVYPTDIDTTSCLGVTVSKKVSKLAVVRNAIKRQTKEFFRHKQHELKNTELVITAKPSCGVATIKQRQNSLDLLWEKVLKWQAWNQAKTKTSLS